MGGRSHGFHEALLKACNQVVFRYDSSLDEVPVAFEGDSIKALGEVVRRTCAVVLYYAPTAAFPPKAIDSPYNGTVVSKFVDRMVQMVDDNLFRGRRSEFQHRDSALVRLRQIATEIVTNACEHAYPPDRPGPVYAYARLRHHNDHIRVQPFTEQETDVETKADAPLIQHIHDVTGDRYLEFFVCDIGKGLVSDIDDWHANTSDAQIRAEFAMQGNRWPKFPLRKLLSMVFRLPVSRHKRNVETETVFRSNVTGLAHVNTVLSQHLDRSRIFVSPEWTAGEHPRPPNYNGGPSDTFFSVAVPLGIAPNGSYFHFAIDVTTRELPLDSYWLRPADNDEVFVKSEFFKLRESFKPSATVVVSDVFDLRQLLQETLEQKAATDEDVERNWQHYLASHSPLSVVRMSRDFRKNLTDRIIRHWAASISNGTTPATLAFCDLSQAQAILLKEHLTNITQRLTNQPNETASLATVIVIAENLVACVLELGHSGTANHWSFKVRASPPIASDVMPILASIRSHDSVVFWSRVASLCGKVQLLIKDVQWSASSKEFGGIKLPVYLDYSLAVQDRELAKIIRRSLRRALSAFPELEVHSVDELIKPDLDDALRWTRREPSGSHAKSLFVISSIVTGTTIALAMRHRGTPAAVLGCFFVETSPPTAQSSLHFSALDWKPQSNFSLLPMEKLWERIPGTPYVRPFSENYDKDQKLQRISLVRRIPRNLEEGKPGKNALPSVTQAYNEWHRDKLLRVGHWIVDRRHGLIEIDHTRALQISAESRQGFYSWLAKKLEDLKDEGNASLLVYPASRLNAILIRHLFKMRGFNGKNWHALPINYLPDVGDGMRQISPLTSEQMRKAASKFGGVAVFMDIGFVGNRTFRHTARQMKVLGIGKVIGIGLVNRTSYPAIYEEMKDADVECYWRIDIPTLDDERSCPICKGLDALLTLREKASTFQTALVPCINGIRGLWALNEPSLSWWDHGLDPIPLPKGEDTNTEDRDTKTKRSFHKKFGFSLPARQPTILPPLDDDGVQSMLISNEGEAVPAFDTETDLWPADVVTWNMVHLRSSTQAAAYGIEMARTQAAHDYPWRLAQQIAEAVKSKVPADQEVDNVSSGAAVAVEIAACHLVLCGGDLAVASREQGANLLLRYLVELEAELANESHPVATEQLRRLRGLAALAFANLDPRTKRLLLESVVDALSSVRIVNQETCVALMAIVSNGEHDASHPLTLHNSFERLVNDLFGTLNASADEKSKNAAEILIGNFRLITVTERGIADQFKDALRFFGTAEHHGEYLILRERAKGGQSDNGEGDEGLAK